MKAFPTADEIEKDIVWKKLNGIFDSEHLRKQYVFVADGSSSMYQIDLPIYNYSLSVYVASALIPACDYIIHEISQTITIILDQPAPANSNIQVNICY